MSELSEYRIYTKPAELSKAVNTLKGIIEGVKLDEHVNDKEINEIVNWCSLHKHLEDRHPFSEIIPLIEQSLSDGELSPEEIKDILFVCQNYSEESEYYNFITAKIQTLEGICHGILADNIINDKEIYQLSEWLEDNDFLKGTYPFDEIDSLITSILKDNVISEDERNILMGFFSNFVDTTMSYNLNEFELKNIKNQYSISGICAVCPEVIINNKSFCFTGTSSKISRKDFEK